MQSTATAQFLDIVLDFSKSENCDTYISALAHRVLTLRSWTLIHTSIDYPKHTPGSRKPI
jgi:hypothetical protein